jgi:hypothetical protein
MGTSSARTLAIVSPNRWIGNEAIGIFHYDCISPPWAKEPEMSVMDEARSARRRKGEGLNKCRNLEEEKKQKGLLPGMTAAPVKPQAG